MAWRRHGIHVLVICGSIVAGCVQGRGWPGRKVESPPIAMQPVTISGPEETAADRVEAAQAPEDQPPPATQPATSNNTDQVLAYIERLPREPEQDTPPPARQPAVRPVETSPPPSDSGPVASANAPVSLTPTESQSSAPDDRRGRHAKARPKVAAVRIKSSNQPDPIEEEARALSTNEPLDSTAGVKEHSIAGYAATLEEQLKNSPSDVEAQWRLSALQLATGEEDRAVQISGEIGQEPAGILKGSVGVFAGVRRVLSDPAYPADSVLGQLDGLREKLSTRAELEIPVVALCTRVMTFGVYDEMSPDQLAPYQTNRAIVYSEIRNFASRTSTDGKYETLLTGKLELLTTDGRSIWRHEEPEIKDLSKQRRGDFFLAQLVSFPPDLAPGDYVLKVMIQDKFAGKANEGRLEFSIKGAQFTRK